MGLVLYLIRSSGGIFVRDDPRHDPLVIAEQKHPQTYENTRKISAITLVCARQGKRSGEREGNHSKGFPVSPCTELPLRPHVMMYTRAFSALDIFLGPGVGIGISISC